MHRAHRKIVLFSLLVLIAAVGCTPKTSIKPGRVPTQPKVRVPAVDLSREPVVRILLTQSVNAIEVSGSRGLTIINEQGKRAAEYGKDKKIRLFQRASTPDRISVFIEGRRSGKRVRSEKQRMSFQQSVIIQPERDGTLELNGRRYRGKLLLKRSGGHFHCINLAPLEKYLRGVVPHEIGHLGKMGFEAMKAQAVISRNYAVQKLKESRSQPWDMVDSVYDQVYRGAKDEHDLANKAIDATRGQILWTGKGPAEVYYSSTCGGATAAIGDVWRHAHVKHLSSRRDADGKGRSWCRTSKYFRWTHTWTARELGRILRSYLPAAAGLAKDAPVGHLIDLTVRSYTPEGRAEDLEVLTTLGTFHVMGDRVRSALKRDLRGRALRSIMFRLDKKVDSAGRLTRVTAYGAGWGHGIGMCQVGAINRSKEGQGYARILGAYFPDTSLKRLWR